MKVVSISKKKQPAAGALRMTGTVLLILSLLLLTWLLPWQGSKGWLLHADNYGAGFRISAYLVRGCSGLVTAGVLLYLLRKDLIAAVLGTVSGVTVLAVLLRAMQIAEERGWSGRTEASFGLQAATVWRNGLAPSFATVVLLLLLALTRYFSLSERALRQQKRDAKERAENASAPSILDSGTDRSA